MAHAKTTASTSYYRQTADTATEISPSTMWSPAVRTGRLVVTAASAHFSARASPSALIAAKKMLGLAPTAHAAEGRVKAAFRKRALELHPDTNPGPGAEGKFIELQRCFEVAMAAAAAEPPRDEEPLRREPFRQSRAETSHITFEEF